MKKIIIALMFFFPTLTLASFSTDINYGMRSNVDVQALQEFLTEENLYSGPITGNFFSLTLKAVKDFQIRENISPVSGYVGPKTRARINEIMLEKSSNLTDESGSIITIQSNTPTTNEDIIKGINNQLTLLLDQLAELKAQQQSLQTQQTTLGQIQAGQAQQQQTLETQQQTINTIAQNTTPPPVPPAPTTDTTAPVFTSGPTATIVQGEDGNYRLTKVDYTTDEPTTVVWNTDKPDRYSCNGLNISPTYSLNVRTTYDCTIKVVDKAGNTKEALFTFTTGMGAVKFETQYAGGLMAGHLYRATITNEDTENKTISAISIKIQKSGGVFDINHVTPIILGDGIGGTILSSYPQAPIILNMLPCEGCSYVPYETMTTINLNPAFVLKPGKNYFELNTSISGGTAGSGSSAATRIISVQFLGDTPFIAGLNHASTISY